MQTRSWPFRQAAFRCACTFAVGLLLCQLGADSRLFCFFQVTGIEFSIYDWILLSMYPVAGRSFLVALFFFGVDRLNLPNRAPPVFLPVKPFTVQLPDEAGKGIVQRASAFAEPKAGNGPEAGLIPSNSQRSSMFRWHPPNRREVNVACLR